MCVKSTSVILFMKLVHSVQCPVHSAWCMVHGAETKWSVFTKTLQLGCNISAFG